MENSKFALTGVKLVNVAVFEILCLPSSSSNLAEELSVLSVASASCYSYPSVLPEMSELAPRALAKHPGARPSRLREGVVSSTHKLVH